jgi:hypothetical protein
MKRLFGFTLAALALYAAPSDNGSGIKFLGTTEGPAPADSLSTEAKQVGDQQGRTTAGIKFLTDTVMQEAAQNGAPGFTGKMAQVSKQGGEGLLTIDAFTGMVVMNEDTPEWATDLGLVTAVLTERHSFYASRLGQKYADTHVSPEVYAFEDLAWLSIVDDGAEGQEVLTDADEEHRMEVLAAVLGVNREDGEIEGALVSGEFISDNTRTAAELAALEESTAAPVAVEAQG